MLFSCTKRVLDKIKKHKVVEVSKEEISLHNWYVDSIVINRKNYFLFTNSLTLFSFFEYIGTKKEILNLEAIFQNRLEQQLVKEVTSIEAKIKIVIPETNQFRFAKTNSRSVIGSMNEFKNHLKAHVESDGELDLLKMQKNYFLNEMIMGAIKYKRPKEMMMKVLELR